MPPIPLHIDDPIRKSEKQDDNTSVSQAGILQQQSSPYPAAQPGAASFPAPTPYAPAPHSQPTPTRTTTNTQNDGPPPPQPGAVPTPGIQQAPMTASSTLPPPPKAGEAARQQPPVTTMPAQMGIPPPQQNYAPVHGTTTGPTTLNFGPVSSPAASAPSSHPPGYQQNLFAQEMSSAQRASLDQQERHDAYSGGLPVGGGGGGGGGGEDSLGNAWNAVKGWATVAGNKLAETEQEVWKRINGPK